MDPGLATQVRAWIDDDPDPAARAELSALLAAGDAAALRDRFGARLAFGTAGLRGPLRAGPNGMNRAVVRRAAAGLARYLGPAERWRQPRHVARRLAPRHRDASLLHVIPSGVNRDYNIEQWRKCIKHPVHVVCI